MNMRLKLFLLPLIAAGLIASFASVAPAAVYINEIYFNPTLATDSTREYIELRGTPGMSLANHYLIFVDTPINNGFGTAGVIQHIFNFNNSNDCPTGCSLGTNGYLTIRQNTFGGGGYAVAAGTTSLTNHFSGAGFGSGATSSIGASDSNANGEIASGFTAMLIRTDGTLAPSLNFDVDNGNNGLDTTATDSSNWRDHWTILDGIGLTEPGEAYDARFYANINYGTEVDDGVNFVASEHLEPGAKYMTLGFNESEYAARWGNSTGQTASDWHVAGLTDNAGSGYQTGTWNFRMSTDEAHPAPNATNLPPSPMPTTTTSTQGVPYGTIITNTLGAPNFLLGDYNEDGFVTAADYVIWRKRVGQTGTDIVDNPADGNHDYSVNAPDFTVWRAHFGQPLNNGSPGAGSSSGISLSTIPEPTGWRLAALTLLGATQFRRRPAS